mgnify:CR=1 FL=1
MGYFSVRLAADTPGEDTIVGLVGMALLNKWDLGRHPGELA